MNLDQAISSRRSIRDFNGKKVTKEELTAILNAARLAPSAKNRQPWNFVILKSDQKDKVAELMAEWKMDDNVQKTEGHAITIKPSAKAIKSAASLIVIYREINHTWKNSDTLSIGAAVQNMCLKATDLNLGSLWICDIRYVMDEVNEYLGINNMELITSVAIGKFDKNPLPRPRKELVELIIK